MRKFKIEEFLIKWISNMLQTRKLTASRDNTDITRYVETACPQGGILSPILWSMVVNELLKELEKLGIIISAYVDDIVFLVINANIILAKRLVQRALNVINSWCDRTVLLVNPDKLEVILFTRRINKPIIKPSYDNKELKLLSQTRFLGVHTNSRLTWRNHIFKQLETANKNIQMLCRVIGPTWGLTPITVKWIYEAIIIPRLTFGAVVWWQATNMLTVKNKLDSVQVNAMRRITGAMRTTPTRALEVILGMKPLDIIRRMVALRTAHRLISWNSSTKMDRGHNDMLNIERNERIRYFCAML